MQATKVMANLHVADIDAAKRFYAGYLGLTTEEFNLAGWPGLPLRTARRWSSS
jgi:predicted enzyme related to lactoylglutathione lyase